MIDVNQLRNGTAFELDGVPYLVLKYEFTKMGRGNAVIKVRVRNLKTGAVLIKSFNSGRFVEEVQLKRKKMQYLYSDSNSCIFMDPVSFEQIEVEKQLIEEQKQFLQDGMEVQVLFWSEQPLSVELPLKMTLIVKETGPGEKGNSVSNLYKPAVLENGLQVKVPLFVKQGEKVVIDTRTSQYIARG